MNLITPDGGLLFWMVVIFAIVFFLLAKFGFPIITQAVEKRSDRIADSLVKADEVEKRVAQMDVEHSRMLEETRKEQAKMLKEASEARDLILEKAKADAAEETARMIEHARMQIEADRRSAEADMRRQVAMLSVEVAEKVLRKTLSSSSEQSALIDRLVDEAAKTAEKPQS
ncbi:MAG: F0F1 ATP synthase subunit B [Bacteroidales bacterium]|nr:F0F1 ATP synthase subunit B [Bacteroidales bacterium]